MRESLEQKYLFEWVSAMSGKYPCLDLMYHIPNGGKRDARTGYRLKTEGVKAGVPDIFLPVAKQGYYGLYIELKVGKNKPSKLQNMWLDNLKEQGYQTNVCYGWESAAGVIEEYLK